jgi:hypothetical protein
MRPLYSIIICPCISASRVNNPLPAPGNLDFLIKNVAGTILLLTGGFIGMNLSKKTGNIAGANFSTMHFDDYLNIIPEQKSGEEAEVSACYEAEDLKEAEVYYQVVRDRLLDVNYWHQVAGIVSAVFQLVDANGEEVLERAGKGNYIRIDIPGPGSKEGSGYDWVFIEMFIEIATENKESAGFRVRPTRNPKGSNSIAHFYSAAATSSFIVTRYEKKISVRIVDRNLHPNDDTHSLTDEFRHTALAISAIGGFSKIQWKRLAEGLLKKNGDQFNEP